MAKIKLKPKKEKWVQQFKPTLIKGKPLMPNVAIEKDIQARIEKLVDKMTKEVSKEIIKTFRREIPSYFAEDTSITSQSRILLSTLSQKFEKIFDIEGYKIAETLVFKADKHSKQSVLESIKQMTGGTVIDIDRLSNQTKETLKASVNQAVQYITSIQSQYLEQVKGAVYRSITQGEGLKDLIPALEKYEGMTKRRAKNIALDQTRKAMTTLNQARLKQNGITKFMWNHSSSSKDPRETHQEFDGKVYSFDDLPFDRSVGRRVYVGELPYCRCFATPVIELNES